MIWRVMAKGKCTMRWRTVVLIVVVILCATSAQYAVSGELIKQRFDPDGTIHFSAQGKPSETTPAAMNVDSAREERQRNNEEIQRQSTLRASEEVKSIAESQLETAQKFNESLQPMIQKAEDEERKHLEKLNALQRQKEDSQRRTDEMIRHLQSLVK